MHTSSIHGLADRMDYYSELYHRLLKTAGGAITQEVKRPADYEQRREKALAMLRAGQHNAREIAAACGIEQTRVYNLAARNGLKCKPIRTWNTWTK